MARYDYRRTVTQYKDDYMSTGKWIRTFILLLIPGINIIAFFVWLFGGGRNNTRTNYIRASVLFAILITIVFVVVYFVAKTSPMQALTFIKDWFVGILPF